MTFPLDPIPAPPGIAAADQALRPAFGQMKRFGEWYLACPDFRAAAQLDPAGTADRYGLELTGAEARALLLRDLLGLAGLIGLRGLLGCQRNAPLDRLEFALFPLLDSAPHVLWIDVQHVADVVEREDPVLVFQPDPFIRVAIEPLAFAR